MERIGYAPARRKLGLIGQVLALVDIRTVEVRLSRELAGAAVTAWERECHDEAPETAEQRPARHRARSLAFIGQAIKKRGGTRETQWSSTRTRDSSPAPSTRATTYQPPSRDAARSGTVARTGMGVDERH